MKIFLLLHSSYFCRLTSKSSNDPYKVCSPILRYYYTILNIHYKVLLMKIFLLLQSSYFCRLTSKSSNDLYKVCSPILRYGYTILNTHYKLLLIKIFLFFQSSYFCRLTSKSSNNHHKNMKIATIKIFSSVTLCNGYSKLYSHISRLDYKLCMDH